MLAILVIGTIFWAKQIPIRQIRDTWRVEGLRRNCSKAAWKLLSPEVEEEKKPSFRNVIYKIVCENNVFLVCL